MYLDMETFATLILVIVDDWYIANAQRYLHGKVGDKPTFTDSEVLTLMVLKEFLPFKAERRFLKFMKANYLCLFPKLLDQSQFNRRARNLRLILNQLRIDIAKELGVQLAKLYVVDTAPVPVVGYKRNKKHSHFRGSADYGYCVSKKLHYWGYKFVLLVTADGIPVAFELVPANTDEREAAEEVLDQANSGSIVLGDKGFIDQERQSQWQAQYQLCVHTFKRINQKLKNPPEVEMLLQEYRSQIETTLSSIKRVEELEQHLAKTVIGLARRIIAKLTAYTLRHYLFRIHEVDVLNFQFAHPQVA